MYIPPRFTIEDDDPDLLWRFSAYIKKVVYYARLEYMHKLKSCVSESSLDQVPPELLSYEETYKTVAGEFCFDSETLSGAFVKLNPLRREILTLVFAEGLSAQETADRLNCSVDYVYLQKHRALKKLRDQLIEGGDRNGK